MLAALLLPKLCQTNRKSLLLRMLSQSNIAQMEVTNITEVCYA
jgi:hypothetical protein